MVWKTSKSGRRYLYRNRRRGNRVHADYVGTGAVAELAVRAEALHRAERQAELRAWQEQQRRCDELNASVEKLCAAADRLLIAQLLLAGCHRHEWAWRRRRVKRRAQQAA
jgi:hypothetical protein